MSRSMPVPENNDSGFEAFLGAETTDEGESEDNDDSAFELLCKIRTGETLTTKRSCC